MAILALVVALTACKSIALDAPRDLVYADGVLSWSAVEHADAYKVSVDGVEVAEVTQTYYVYQAKGQTTFAVKAVSNAKRYTASSYSEDLVYKPSVDNRQTLNAPTVIEVNGEGLLSWSYVVNATGYRIFLNGSLLDIIGNQTQYVLAIEGTGAYTVQVQAVGNEAYRDSARSATYRVEVADGKIKAPSVSAPAVSFDIATHRVWWLAVAHALRYAVYQNNVLVAEISADDAAHREVSGATYMHYYSPTINVRSTRLTVLAIADGVTYSDSGMSNVLSFPLVSTGVPQNLHGTVVDGTVCLAWDKLDNSAGYLVKVEQGDAVLSVHTVNTNRVQLSLPDGTYRVSVAGDGDGYLFTPTEYSAQAEVSFLGYKMLPISIDSPSSVFVNDKTVHFSPVANAAGYQILLDTPYDDELGTYTIGLDQDKDSFNIPSYLYGTVLTAYVRALGADGYDDSYWSTGACYYPVNDPNDVEYYLAQLDQQEGGTGEERDVVIYPAYSVLPVPAGLGLNADTLVWGAVSGATGYELVVDGVSTVLNETEYTLDMSTVHVCKVRALSNVENVLDSPYTVEFEVAKTRFDAPRNIKVSGHILSWDTVAGAEEFGLNINDQVVYTSSPVIDLEKQLPYDGTYIIRVFVKSAYDYRLDSLYSQTITFVADYEESGTEHKPYTINAKEDLALLEQYPDAYFVLTQDVAVGDISPLFGVKNAFSGTIDGRGYALTDIALKLGEADSNGIFGCLYGAVLKNIHLEFASATWDESSPMGLVAGEVVQSTFDTVSVTATVWGAKTFGTVGVSTGSTYTDCTFDVHYIQTSETAYVGGVVAKSKQDTFERCTVAGSLTGGVYMGALAAQATGSTVTSCVIGTEDAPFAYAVYTGYAGAIGKGTLEECTLNTVASVVLQGNCYVGGFGGHLTCSTIAGRAKMTVLSEAGTLYVAGCVGYAVVDVAEVDVDLELMGTADTLYAGGLTGYAQGLCVCRDTSTITIFADFAATEGRYLGGLIGFGTGAFSGAATGNIHISNTVDVGRLSGTVPTATEAGWIVTEKK